MLRVDHVLVAAMGEVRTQTVARPAGPAMADRIPGECTVITGESRETHAEPLMCLLRNPRRSTACVRRTKPCNQSSVSQEHEHAAQQLHREWRQWRFSFRVDAQHPSWSLKQLREPSLGSKCPPCRPAPQETSRSGGGARAQAHLEVKLQKTLVAASGEVQLLNPHRDGWERS
jgi:hypothetical protein